MEQAMNWNDVTLAIPTMPERRSMVHGLVKALMNECPHAALVIREHKPGTSARVDFPAIAAQAIIVDKPWTLFVELSLIHI